MLDKVNLVEKFSDIQDYWKAKVAGDINDFQVKLVKVMGEFIWHHHEFEDELFLVVKGRLQMRFRDRDVVVEPGEFIIVPHGVEHMPVAAEETHILLFEPKTTLNTALKILRHAAGSILSSTL